MRHFTRRSVAEMQSGSLVASMATMNAGRAQVWGLLISLLWAANTAVAADDPFLWLEEVEGERALQWVRAQNERSLPQLMDDPRYRGYYATAFEITADRSRIPTGALQEGWLYNFWQNETHVRGIWRR